MKFTIGHVILAGAVFGAYYLGRQSGIKDQKAADAAGTNLLGQPTQAPGAIAGTTPTATQAGSTWFNQNLNASPAAGG